MFHLKNFSNTHPGAVMPSEMANPSKQIPTKGAGNYNPNSGTDQYDSDARSNHGNDHENSNYNDMSNNNKNNNINNNINSKKKRSRRRRKPKSHSKVEPLNPATPKKQHDAPMTKRDLYFSLVCEVVKVGEEANRTSVARVTIVNWDTEVILDTFVGVPFPVTDFCGTGITPADVHHNPQAMDFATVRQTVERILCGKILIGYKLHEHLFALGLSHPSTDVRDAAFYCGSPQEEKRSIEELAKKVLQRTLPHKHERHRSIEVCIAALDLYKANRQEWEMNLIQHARESEQQRQQFRSQMPPLANHKQMPFVAPQAPLAQPMAYPMHPLPQHPHASLQQVTVPTNYLPAAASHPYGQGTYLAHSLQQQQALMLAAQNHAAEQAQARQNSSWFSLGRKPRYPQQPMPPTATTTAQASLSSQALEALSYPTSSLDYYDGSSAYDGSTGYDRSTDYGSSQRYEGSVVSESVESVVSESIASYHDDSENIPSGGDFHQQSRPQSSENSSWFRFGSRKSRYAQHQREPMTVVQESNEAEDPAVVQEYQEVDNVDDSKTATYEPPRYFESGNHEGKKHSSSWLGFGFKKSKSPGVGKKERTEEIIDDAVETDTLPEIEVPIQDSEIVPPVDIPAGKTEISLNEKQSSWFKFGKRSGARSKSPTVDAQLQDDHLPLDEVVTLHTESSEATDEDWWQEVMNQPGIIVDPDESDLHPEDQQQWMKESPTDGLVSDNQTLDQSGSKSSNWFRFLRSAKSAQPQDDSKKGSEECLEQASHLNAIDSNDETWQQESEMLFDSSCLGPAWYASTGQSDEKAHTVTFSPESKTMVVDDLLPLRARLHTESTIQTAATESEEEEDFSQEFVQGMEKNFSFLNI